MFPGADCRWTPYFGFWLLLFAGAALGEIEPQGLLIYQQPSTSSTEAWEYRSFAQQNPLYVTVVTFNGERKRLPAGGVIAVVDYPPPSFDPDFAEAAQRALARIDSLAQSYPLVRTQLQAARGKWSRALSVFNQIQTRAVATPASLGKSSHGSSSLALRGAVYQDARLTGMNSEGVTIAHAAGVMTIPLAELTAAQIVQLNRTSDKVQLPLGFSRPMEAKRVASPPALGTLTARVDGVGKGVVRFCSAKLGVNPESFSAWAFFVVLPGLVLFLLLGWLAASQRRVAPRTNNLRPGRGM